MRTHSERQASAGFSLIEVLVGVCILLFILFPAFQVITQGSRILACSRMETLASSQLQTVMEDLRAMTFADMQAAYLTGKTQPVALNALLPSEKFTGAFSSKYYLSGTFSSVPGKDSRLDATLSISWVDAFGRVQTRSYYSRFSSNGLSDQILRGF